MSGLENVHRTQPITVLHVDDDPDLTAVTAAALERTPHPLDVATETSPERALSRLQETPVDCVLSDYEMPSIDGLELLDRVRERYPKLPFVLYTGKGGPELGARALERGADEFMHKRTAPEQYDLLANRLTNLVQLTETSTGLEGVLADTSLGLAICETHDAQILAMNDWFRDQLDLSPAAVAGETLPSLLSTSQSLTEDYLRETFQAAIAEGEQSFEWSLPDAGSDDPITVTIRKTSAAAPARALVVASSSEV